MTRSKMALEPLPTMTTSSSKATTPSGLSKDQPLTLSVNGSDVEVMETMENLPSTVEGLCETMNSENAPPKRTQAFMEGYACQQPKTRNPYKKDGEGAWHHLQWNLGWERRYYGESP